MKKNPNSTEIEEINKKLEKAEGTKAIPKNVTPLERFRFDKIKHKCSQNE